MVIGENDVMRKANVFTSICHSVHGGHAWQGGMCGRGHMYDRGQVWQGGCVWWGACMVEGRVWQDGDMFGRRWGMHGKEGVCGGSM